MKEIKTGKGSWLFVEVPDDAKDISLTHKVKDFPIQLMTWNDSGGNWHIKLPKGSYKFLATTKGISEEQAAGIADTLYLADKPMAFENYGFGLPKYKTAHESLQSLLRSHELNPELNYAILQSLKTKDNG
jgi:hypothetical protein